MPNLFILPPYRSYMQIFHLLEHICCSSVGRVGVSSLLTPTPFKNDLARALCYLM